MDKKNYPPSGFTLIETLVSVSILMLVIAIGGDYIINALRSTTFVGEQEMAIEIARKSMEVMTKETRGANTSDQGYYPLNRAESDDFIFFSDIEYDGETEKVRYYVDGSELKKVVNEPGAAKDYNTPSSTTTIATYVNNQVEDIFVYYDRDYNETADIDNIRLVHIVLKINVTPERAPNDFYLETDVHLRNLKDNL